ncbi:uncharacterized protein PG998_007653 [Apiospora kogelbergensis]|uniref:Spo12-like protein n=1 Tax=Apiospora kogelbergensis TaxID=1337665 RepID=A0AAW0QEI8_9PEZI
MSSANVLSPKDTNNHIRAVPAMDGAKPDVKSMEYHRQVLHNKMEEEKNKKTYISPSDNIMSPCTAKLNALRNKQVGKAKPKSLFAQASARKLTDENVLGASSPSVSSS